MNGEAAFKRLLFYCGQGNPQNALAFVGVEGGDSGDKSEIKLDFSTEKEKQSFYKKYLGQKLYQEEECYWDEVNNNNNNKSSDKKYYSPIWRVSSQICVGLNTDEWKNKKIWGEFENNGWGKNDSGTCFTNLYPLEKRKLTKSHSDKLFKIFNIGNSTEYYKIVKCKRFPLLRNQLKKTQAIICYGKSEWDNFKIVFDLKDKKPQKEEQFFVTYETDKNKIILTRHFANGFPHRITEQIIEQLKSWDVQIPTKYKD
jgi:hypothetical protein